MAIKFEEVLHTLTEGEGPLNHTLLRRLANLNEEDCRRLYAAWGGIPVERRRQVIQGITEMLEADFDADYNLLIRLALTDLDEGLREAAVEASWTDESPEMLRRLMPMASVDTSNAVRAAALSALGRFILQAELGKFDSGLARQAENLAIRLFNDLKQDVEVRCRALEAIGNCSRAEVAPMIRQAYHSGDARLRASAVFAMGRSCDEQWAETVLSELSSDDPAIRFEAVRAAGELELEDSVPRLAEMLIDDDRQILEMAIWALGEIGSSEARRLLNGLIEYAESLDDDKLLEQIEDALATASLGGGLVFDV